MIDRASGVVLWRDDDHAVLIAPRGTRVASSGVLSVVTIPGDNLVVAAETTPDRRSTVVVDAKGEIYIVDLESGTARSAVAAPPELATENRNYLGAGEAAVDATAGLVALVKPALDKQHGKVDIIEIASDSTVGTIPYDDVDSVAFIGTSLLLGRRNHPLEVWDQRGGQVRHTIADLVYPVGNHTGTVVAESRGGKVNIIDLVGGTQLGTLVVPPLEAPAYQRTSVAFSADNRRIVTVTNGGFQVKDGVLVVRDLAPDSLIDTACAAAGSPLTQEEISSITGLARLPHIPCDMN